MDGRAIELDMPPQEISSFITTNTLGCPETLGGIHTRLLVTLLRAVDKRTRQGSEEYAVEVVYECASRDIISIDFCVCPRRRSVEADSRERWASRGGC